MLAKYWDIGLIVLLMGGGGLLHLFRPEIFFGFIFPPFPPKATVIISGVLEIGIAILVLIPSTRSFGGLLFALLCVGYMPLHIWDLLRDDPVISPLSLAVARVFLQVFFIWVGWTLWIQPRF